MVLRIEDIDTPRVLPDADRWIMDDLTWLGMDWDGEPVYQSQRLDLYEQAMRLIPCRPGSADAAGGVANDAACDTAYGASVDRAAAQTADASAGASCAPVSTPVNTPPIPPSGMVGTGWQYPCFCSRADIRAASAPQEGDGFQIYPGTCRRLAVYEPQESARLVAQHQRHSWRLAMPAPHAPANTVMFTDRVFGVQTYDLSRSVGDSIIRRSDGLFSYQFVVTVDDLAMGVDSIVRGRDLLRSTALQSWIRATLLANGFAVGGCADSGRAFDPCISDPRVSDPRTSKECASNAPTPSSATPVHPEYAHIPLIDNAAGRRLAKRERSLDMGALRKRGVTAMQVAGCCAYLLGLIPAPEPCTPASLLSDFSWEPLQRSHDDRILDPASPQCPDWLADAVG